MRLLRHLFLLLAVFAVVPLTSGCGTSVDTEPAVEEGGGESSEDGLSPEEQADFEAGEEGGGGGGGGSTNPDEQ